jgi:hypothetical protein
VCDVEARLLGPRGRVYATTRAVRIKSGRRRIALRRTRYKLAKGSYKLRVTALSRLGDRVVVRSKLKGKLT